MASNQETINNNSCVGGVRVTRLAKKRAMEQIGSQFQPTNKKRVVLGDLSNNWQEIKLIPGCLWPSARSGFQLFVYQDDIYLYGGYSKEVSSYKNSSEKGIVHHDMWILDPKTWVWNKVKKGRMPPGPRVGFSMCVHKKVVVVSSRKWPLIYQYMALVRAQSARVEMIDGLFKPVSPDKDERMIREMLTDFYSTTSQGNIAKDRGDPNDPYVRLKHDRVGIMVAFKFKGI
ncbi:hypothetical protein CTI12_AA424430 [Artemisia annua]|uniref:Galactose oxidase/kelch repeat superfamily protein n=1 Tax=Artemisia annua TaxID=35608 RepID=A0A2U1M2Z0_ARTAN|nr:hypothetical protein CTI12_AA424430 [Artemisia annua]